MRQPVQKGRSCLERRLKRCQTDVQMQGQPLQPCIAPRALRGHPSSRVEILQSALHDACADKNFFTKTPPHQITKTPPYHTTTKIPPHHHKKTTTPQTQKHHKSTTITKMPPHHHKNNKPPPGIEPMTSRLLNGCNANCSKLSLPWDSKGPILTRRGAEKNVRN